MSGLRWPVLLLSLAQVPAASFSLWSGLGMPIGARSDAVATPIVPAGYAFAIWTPIFALSIAHAAAAFLPRWRRHPAFDPLALPALLGAGLNCAWMLWAQLVPFAWPLFVLIVGILIAALVGLLRASALPQGGPGPLARVYFGLFAGWLTAACFVAVRSNLPEFGPLLPEPLATLVPLAGSFALAVAIARRTGSWAYVAAVAWALVGIAVANGSGQPAVTAAALVLAVALPVLAWRPARAARSAV